MISNSPEETEALAASLASKLKPGDVVALSGELGSGKTCFVRGLARGLGSRDDVSSPTFVLDQPYAYNGGRTLHHVDLYRLDTEAEVDALLLDEYDEDLVVIEWPERSPRLLERARFCVVIAVGQHPNQRIINVTERR